MRKVLFAILATAMLALAACGGGGGGGGSGPGSSVILDPFSPPAFGADDGTPVSGEAQVLSSSIPDGSQLINHPDYTLIKTATGLQLAATTMASPRAVNLAFNSDFKDSGDFITAVHITPPQQVSNAHAVGTFSAMDVIYLGGHHLNLEHSEFGMWAISEHYKASGGIHASANMYEAIAFRFGEADKAKGFSGGAPVTYQGATIGRVANPYRHVDLRGSAKMTVNQAGSPTAALDLDFENFYKLQITGININAGGGFDGQTTMAVVPNGPNTTGFDSINVGSMGEKWVGGQFYGSAAGNPTEAVGTYYFGNQPEGVSIKGSFGVVK